MTPKPVGGRGRWFGSGRFSYAVSRPQPVAGHGRPWPALPVRRQPLRPLSSLAAVLRHVGDRSSGRGRRAGRRLRERRARGVAAPVDRYIGAGDRRSGDGA